MARRRCEQGQGIEGGSGDVVGAPDLALRRLQADQPSSEHPSKNKPRKHVMVQFTDMSLHPSIAQVVEEGRVSWVNYGSMYQGSIVFSDEVAAFTCSDLRPNR